MKKQTWGTDPEQFLSDKSSKIVQALRVLGHDKHDPIGLGNGIVMYADNALIETSFPPADSIDGIIFTLREAFKRMLQALKGEYSLMPMACHRFDRDELDDPRLWESGCNPNFDVYARRANPPAKFVDGTRTGSFHIHIGDERISKPHEVKVTREQAEAVMLLDIYLGCASILCDKDPTAPERRKLYGRAGEFRPCDYGVEYRVLGNWALRLPETALLMYELAAHAMRHFDERADIFRVVNLLDVQAAINTNDRVLAKKILEIAAMPYKLMQRIEREYPAVEFAMAWGL